MKYGEHRLLQSSLVQIVPHTDWQSGVCRIALRMFVFMKKQKGFDSVPRTEYTDCE